MFIKQTFQQKLRTNPKAWRDSRVMVTATALIGADGFEILGNVVLKHDFYFSYLKRGLPQTDVCDFVLSNLLPDNKFISFTNYL